MRKPFQLHSRAMTWLALLLVSCTSPEREKTRISMDVFSNKEIRIEPARPGKDSVQIATIVEGDSTIFLYSAYTDYGEEGGGRNFCFYIDGKKESSEFSNHGNEIPIIAFGTGMLPNYVDTIKTYDFKVSILQNAIRIEGQVGGRSITGTYVPK